MSTKIIEVTGSEPVVTVDQDVSNVSVVNQPIEVIVQSAVAVGNATIRNALGAIDPIWYDKVNGVFGFIDRSEVVRSELIVDASATPDYAGEFTGVVNLDSEQFDIFPIQIAGAITEFDFGNIASGQTVTVICSQSATPGFIDESSPAWANWFWTNNNNEFPNQTGATFIIKVLWTGNTYYASLIEFDTVIPESQVGIPVSPVAPENPEPGWLWYDTTTNSLMIYVDGSWLIAGGGGGANVIVSETQPTDPPPAVGDLWYDTGVTPAQLRIYNGSSFEIVNPADQGPRGFTGSRGAMGYTGSAGSDGTDGFTGSRGFDGSIGFTGSRGDSGFTGSASTAQGPKGFDGSRGFTGSRGNKGYTGSQGSTGPIGETGYSGSRGFQGYTGSLGDQGFTGSASTIAGPTGFTGSTGSGFTGSVGDQGIQGFTGSRGLDGTGASMPEPPADGEQYARVLEPGETLGDWEIVASASGGDWDGILFDKFALIQQPTLNGDNGFAADSGIAIGKNGLNNVVNSNQHNNLAIGRNTSIEDGKENITIFGSNMPVRINNGWNLPDNSALFGNNETRNFYLGFTLCVKDFSDNSYGSLIDVLELSPVMGVAQSRDMVVTTNGSLMLVNDYDPVDKEQMLHIKSTKVRHSGTVDTSGALAHPEIIRREIYSDPVNIVSSQSDVGATLTEMDEIANPDQTWRSPRNINYISPERTRFRKFAECVNYQAPGDTDPAYPDQSFSGPDMDIDLNRGTIQHKILQNNVTNLQVADSELTDGSQLRSMGLQASEPDPGTSITILLYHKAAIKTIAWPTNFKFLGGDNTLSTQPETLPVQTINGVTFSDIVAVDMICALYDGNTWWSSITRGYS